MKRSWKNIFVPGLLCLALLPLSGTAQDRVAEAENSPYLKVSDGILILEGAPVDLPSTNMFDLVHLYINDRAAGYNKLMRARQSGFRMVRFFAGGMYNEASTLFPAVEMWEDPATKAIFFQAMDQLVSDALSLEVKLVPVLITAYSDPDERFRASGAACNNTPFSLPVLPGSDNRQTMIRYATDIVSRYRTSTTVLFWEISNEANLIAKHRAPSLFCVTREEIVGYFTEVAAEIKRIDPNHLVASGAMQEDDSLPLADIPGPFNDAGDYFTYYTAIPNIDIGTVHIYSQYSYFDGAGKAQSAAEFLSYFNNKSIAMNRPLWIGEFGVPGGTGWSDNNFHDTPMSFLLARHYLGIGLATVWNWESREYGSPTYHYEMVQYSVDPGEDADIIGVLTGGPSAMGRDRVGVSWKAHAGDFDGDGRDDLLAEANRGLWQVSIMGDHPGIPSQWLSAFSDDSADIGGSPFQRLVGDWDGDGKSDVGSKSRDGRWHVAFSDGRRFEWPSLWLEGFGNDFADGGAPFTAFAGDWNGDGKTDIGVKTRDGRWYTAISNGSAFIGTALAMSNFVDENVDAGGGGYAIITGDWNGDGRTDIGVKSKDGRWFTASSNGSSFVSTREALAGFGNDLADPGSAPFRPIVGDWDGDGMTDVGIKGRDGRWFLATSDGFRFVGPRLALTGFADDTADGGAPFIPFVGDWNGDQRTDVGVKTIDGRWYLAYSNGVDLTSPQFWH